MCQVGDFRRCRAEQPRASEVRNRIAIGVVSLFISFARDQEFKTATASISTLALSSSEALHFDQHHCRKVLFHARAVRRADLLSRASLYSCLLVT